MVYDDDDGNRVQRALNGFHLFVFKAAANGLKAVWVTGERACPKSRTAGERGTTGRWERTKVGSWIE